MSTTSRAAELIPAVLPVTAIASAIYAGKHVLFIGKGSSIEVLDADSERILFCATVLHWQSIHGILLLDTSVVRTHGVRQHLLVYGGRQLVWCVLDLFVRDGTLTCSSLDLVQSLEARDWILCCKKIPDDECSAVYITSYNALHRVKAQQTVQQLDCNLLSDALGVFLYCADIVRKNDKRYLVASGTVFGEVLTWDCMFENDTQTWKTTRWLQFNGHRGSIFGVSISELHAVDGEKSVYIASCSDDRVINIWELPGAEKLDTSLTDSPSGNVFHHRDIALMTTYAHMSRIWSVDLVPGFTSGIKNSLLFSTGEDGQAQSWSLGELGRPQDTNSRLENKHIDRHHAGKNIWTRCISKREDEFALLTGGADGQVVSRTYNLMGEANLRSKCFSQSFRDIQSMISYQSPPKKKSLALKTYTILCTRQLLATTDTGHVLRGIITADEIEWQAVILDSGSVSYAPSTTTVHDLTFFLRASDQNLCAFQSQGSQIIVICTIQRRRIANLWSAAQRKEKISESEEFCIGLSYFDSDDCELIWTHLAREAAPKSHISSLSLPPTFEVTSMLYDENLKLLLCGSRAGALALYTNITSSTTLARPTLCHRHVHGQDSVTSICKLEGFYGHQEQHFYLTTGRDGTYCVLKLSYESEHQIDLTIVHQLSTSLGPDIEGAHVCSRPDGSRAIVLHGFRSKTFVVWDETNQTEVMNVDCGGAHRSWAFALDESNGQGGTFVWTKASTFMYYEQTEPDHKVLQRGGHGREMKALAISRLSETKWLFATGAEDTDIRIFEYTTSSSDRARLKTIAVVKRHTTGLQSMKFSPDGKTLISAAGIEEMFAWTLSPVPIIGHGVVFACALQSTDPQSDARIMDFDMCVHPEDLPSPNPRYLLVAAFSNGKFKTIQLHPATSTTKAYFTTLHQFDFGTICLIQAHFFPASTRHVPSKAIVGATNGFIKILNLSAPNKETPTLVSENHGSSKFLHKIHQNSITALQAIEVTPTHQLIVTGGDDNALGITLVAISTADSTQTFKSMIVPNAHAAALTALQILPQLQRSNTGLTKSFTVLTAGNDQRLQIWGLSVDVPILRQEGAVSEGMDEIVVEFLGEQYTNVADISEIAVLQDDMDTDISEVVIEVLIVGVGMEVLRVKPAVGDVLNVGGRGEAIMFQVP